MARPHQPGESEFRSILPEDIDGDRQIEGARTRPRTWLHRPTAATPSHTDIAYRSVSSSTLADLRSAVSNPSVKRS
jgi:hypothetical protein